MSNRYIFAFFLGSCIVEALSQDSSGCVAMMQCFDQVPKVQPDMTSQFQDLAQYMSDAAAFNEAKTYLFFQLQAMLACGPYQPMMDCMLSVEGECLNMKEQFIKQMQQAQNTMKQAVPGVENVTSMTYDNMVDFVKNRCPHMPNGFGSSECLQKQLMSSAFTTCHQNFSDTYETKPERQNCKAYETLDNCFKNNVKPKCGTAMSDFMVKNTPLIIDGIPSSCVKWNSGSNKLLATSPMIMMAAIFVGMTTLL